MQDKKTVDKVSLLQAFLVSMIAVALLFILLSAGIWIYTTNVLSRQNTLISAQLPELDAAYQLAEATAGLQSQGLLLLRSSDVDELNERSLQLDAIIARARKNVGVLSVQNSPRSSGLNDSMDNLSMLRNNLIDIKKGKFKLQQRIKEKNRTVLAIFASIEKPVQRQIVVLTDRLLEISEQLAESAFDDGSDDTAKLALEFESTNLAIQDYLLFAQDVVSLHAVIDKLPLLTNTEAVDQSIQRRELLLRALVNRSIYFQNELSTRELLVGLRNLHNLLDGDENLFEVQNSIIEQKTRLSELGTLMPRLIASILEHTDLLRDGLRTNVSLKAEKNLAGLAHYRAFLVLVSLIALVVLAGIIYWLVYRKTVLPLVQITRRLDDVGSERFPYEAKPYFLKELSQLSSALVQLDKAQKSMYKKDIEMQLVNEDLKSANLELEQFAHVASHDLQEPLRKLQQFSDLLEEDYASDLDDDGRYFVTSIRNAANRMSTLISDTLAFSRADRSNQSLETVDLSALLSQLCDEVDVAVADAKGEIHVDALPVVKANAVGIAQLFRNLLTNALKYHRPDVPSKVSFRAISANDQEYAAGVIIQVKDNGVGIKQEYLERIFEPFERLHNEGTKGTGLGLAICRKVCKAHGWSLDVHSELGIGSMFEIRIPGYSLEQKKPDSPLSTTL